MLSQQYSSYKRKIYSAYNYRRYILVYTNYPLACIVTPPWQAASGYFLNDVVSNSMTALMMLGTIYQQSLV